MTASQKDFYAQREVYRRQVSERVPFPGGYKGPWFEALLTRMVLDDATGGKGDCIYDTFARMLYAQYGNPTEKAEVLHFHRVLHVTGNGFSVKVMLGMLVSPGHVDDLIKMYGKNNYFRYETLPISLTYGVGEGEDVNVHPSTNPEDKPNTSECKAGASEQKASTETNGKKDPAVKASLRSPTPPAVKAPTQLVNESTPAPVTVPAPSPSPSAVAVRSGKPAPAASPAHVTINHEKNNDGKAKKKKKKKKPTPSKITTVQVNLASGEQLFFKSERDYHEFMAERAKSFEKPTSSPPAAQRQPHPPKKKPEQLRHDPDEYPERPIDEYEDPEMPTLTESESDDDESDEGDDHESGIASKEGWRKLSRLELQHKWSQASTETCTRGEHAEDEEARPAKMEELRQVKKKQVQPGRKQRAYESESHTKK